MRFTFCDETVEVQFFYGDYVQGGLAVMAFEYDNENGQGELWGDITKKVFGGPVGKDKACLDMNNSSFIISEMVKEGYLKILDNDTSYPVGQFTKKFFDEAFTLDSYGLRVDKDDDYIILRMNTEEDVIKQWLTIENSQILAMDENKGMELLSYAKEHINEITSDLINAGFDTTDFESGIDESMNLLANLSDIYDNSKTVVPFGLKKRR